MTVYGWHNMLALPEILTTLKNHTGIKGVQYLSNGAAFVETAWGFFTLCDNGGEINIDKPNVWELCESVPLTYFNRVCNSYTMSYRILQVMQGLEIDYAHVVMEYEK